MFNLKKLVLPLAVAGLVSFGSAAQAATTTYHFGSLLEGSGAPAFAHFAHLTANDDANGDFTTGDWLFTLDLLPAFVTTFGTGAFVRVMAVDGAPDPTGTSIAPGAWGVTSVGQNSGGGPGGSFDFRYVFGQGSGNRLGGTDSVSWNSTGAFGPFANGQLALHVQGLSSAQGNSAWYVSPVPEPETYAMLLAGLGLLGFIARRRKTNAAMPDLA